MGRLAALYNIKPKVFVCTYMHVFTYLLNYLLTQLARAYKTVNISETVEVRAKVTINVR